MINILLIRCIIPVALWVTLMWVVVVVFRNNLIKKSSGPRNEISTERKHSPIKKKNITVSTRPRTAIGKGSLGVILKSEICYFYFHLNKTKRKAKKVAHKIYL